MRLLYTYLAAFLFSLLVLARQPPTSFCKCICFQNSTIIPLNAPPSQSGFKVDKQAASTSTASATSAVHRNLRSLDFEHTAWKRDDEKAAEEEEGERKHRELTCNDCNRAFCIDNVCKDTKEEDVFATCFQRDSLKDETVVLIFIVLTTSLLAWAILKPYVDKFRDNTPLAAYVPIGSGRASRREQNFDGLPSGDRGAAEYTGLGQDSRTDVGGISGTSHYDRLGR